MFPLYFWNPECEIEISSAGIKKLSIKGWYSELLLFFYPAVFPANLAWEDIVHVDYAANGFGRLTPLPDMGWNHPYLDRYLKMQAAITDAFVDKYKRCEYVIFQTGKDLELEYTMFRDRGRLKIRLGDLSTTDRVRLAESVYKWAPHASFNPEAQRRLLGSSILCGQEYGSILLGLLAPAKDFEREHTAHLLINENHKNENNGIIRMSEVFYENGAVFVVLARPKGCTLSEFVREHGPISERKAVSLAKQMCDILSSLHNLPTPIILRSLSPDSLVIDDNDTLVLMDLSLAGKAGDSEQCHAKGRRGYAALEQLSGSATIASDIYSLGATLYFMVTGKEPDPLLGCQIDSCSETSGKISPALADMIAKATHRDPKLHYASAEGLKYDLVLSRLTDLYAR